MAQDKNGISTRYDVTTLGSITAFEEPTYDGEPQEKCVYRSEIGRWGRRNFTVDGEYEKMQLVKFEDIHYKFIPTPEPEDVSNYFLTNLAPVYITGTDGKIAKPANSDISMVFSGTVKDNLVGNETNIQAGKLVINSIVFATNPDSRFTSTIGDYAIEGLEIYDNKLTIKSSYNNNSDDMAFGLCFVDLEYEFQSGFFLSGTCVMYATQDGYVCYYSAKNVGCFYTNGYDMILANGSNEAYLQATFTKTRVGSDTSTIYTDRLAPSIREINGIHNHMYCNYARRSIQGENLGTTVETTKMWVFAEGYSPIPDEYLDDYSKYLLQKEYTVYQERNVLSTFKRITGCTANTRSYSASPIAMFPEFNTVIEGTDNGIDGTHYQRVNSDGACWYLTCDIRVFSWSGYTSGAQMQNTALTSYNVIGSELKYGLTFEDVDYSPSFYLGMRKSSEWTCVPDSTKDEEYADDINNAHRDVYEQSAWLSIQHNYTAETQSYGIYVSNKKDIYTSPDLAKKYDYITLEQWGAPRYEYAGRIAQYTTYKMAEQTLNQYELDIPYDKYGSGMTPAVVIMAKLEKGRKQWKNGNDNGTAWQEDDGTTIWDGRSPSSCYARDKGASSHWKFLEYSSDTTPMQSQASLQMKPMINLYESNHYWWAVKVYPTSANTGTSKYILGVDLVYQPEQPRDKPAPPEAVVNSAVTLTHLTQYDIPPEITLGTTSIKLTHSHQTSGTVTVNSNVTYWDVSSTTFVSTQKIDNSTVGWTANAYTVTTDNRPAEYATEARSATIGVWATNGDNTVRKYVSVKQPPPYLFVLTGATGVVTDSYLTSATITNSYATTTFTVGILSRRVNWNGSTYVLECLNLQPEWFNGLGGGMNLAVSQIQTAGTSPYIVNYVTFSCDMNTSTASQKTQTVTVFQEYTEQLESMSKKIVLNIVQEVHPPPEVQPIDCVNYTGWASIGNNQYQFNFQNTSTTRSIQIVTFWYYHYESGNQDPIYNTYSGSYITIAPGASAVVSEGPTFVSSTPYFPIVKKSDGTTYPSYVTNMTVYWAD